MIQYYLAILIESGLSFLGIGVNKLYPGATTMSPDPRTTDDKFLMEFVVNNNEAEIKKILKATGATEINEKEQGDE